MQVFNRAPDERQSLAAHAFLQGEARVTVWTSLVPIVEHGFHADCFFACHNSRGLHLAPPIASSCFATVGRVLLPREPLAVVRPRNAATVGDGGPPELLPDDLQDLIREIVGQVCVLMQFAVDQSVQVGQREPVVCPGAGVIGKLQRVDRDPERKSRIGTCAYGSRVQAR